MGQNPIVEPNSTLAKAREAMGIEEGDEKDLLTEEEQDAQAEQKPPQSEPKSKSKTEEETEEEESEEEDEDDAEDNPVYKKEIKSTPKTGKDNRTFKAIFSQMGDIQKSLKDLSEKVSSKPEAKEAREVTSDALKELMEEIDAGGQVTVDKLYETFQKKLLADFENQGLLKKDIPDDVKDKLKLLDELLKYKEDIQEQKRLTEEAIHFNKEWDLLLPFISKQFRNATDVEKAEAKKLMDKLSHDPNEGGVVIDEKNKILKPYPLDYIFHRNRDKFEAILKIAKGSRSGEDGGREIIDVDDEDDADLDPENMTPEKWKKHERKLQREHRNSDSDITFVG